MFWRRKGEFDYLEAQLRDGRPEPSEELLRSVSRAVRKHPERSRSAFRIGLAGALTLGLVVTLTALGGISRGAAAATNVVTFVQTGSFASSSTINGGSSSESLTAGANQYVEKEKVCHRTTASDPGNTLTLPPSGAANHLTNHPFDSAGPCLS